MKPLHQDPDATEMMGRQPAVRRLTPSRGLPWHYGTIVGDQRFTAEQSATLISRGLDPLTAPSMTVKRQAKVEEVCYPDYNIPPRYEMPCPVIQTMADGRVRIIAPNGSAKLVRADGWGHRPYTLPACYTLRHAMGIRR